ncbi:hypothetical protein N9L68_08380 [bacterium]|nr:hypothetical protein [bacterium]
MINWSLIVEQLLTKWSSAGHQLAFAAHHLLINWSSTVHQLLISR